MILANLSVPLLGLVDTAILGHLENASTLAAAALGAHLISLLFWSFGFLRMSTTGLTSRLYGAKNLPEVKAALLRALLISAALACMLMLIGRLTLGPLTTLLSSNTHISALSATYLNIRIWSAPATLATYCFVGWFIGLGNSRAALIVLLITNISNGLLDYWLIVILQLDIRGAALASVLAEYIGLITAVIICLSIFKTGSLTQVIRAKLLDRKKFSALLGANLDLFLRTISLLLVFIIISSAGVRLSPEVAAANAILLNLLAFSAYAMDGFAYAAESLCGRAWGKRDFREFWLIAKESTLLALIVGIGFFVTFLVLQEPILALYTNLVSVINEARAVYLWLVFLPLIAIWCYQLDGIFIGIGHTQTMRNAMLFSFLLVFLPLFFLNQNQSNAAIWLAFSVFHMARVISLALPLIAIYRTQKREA